MCVGADVTCACCVLQANLKLFMGHVRKNEIDQVVKLCNRGLDPNFHEHETGGKYATQTFTSLIWNLSPVKEVSSMALTSSIFVSD